MMHSRVFGKSRNTGYIRLLTVSEVISQDLAAHQDAEAVLANPSHGPNMATTQILADPTGILAPLH